MTVGLLESMLGLRPGTIFISMKRYNPARKGEAEGYDPLRLFEV